MTVSIDSPDPELYQRIRGGPLAPVMQGLRELGRRSALADRICVMAVVMKSALRSLQEFPAQLTDLGLKHLVFRGLVDYDFTLAEECPAYDEDDVAVLRSIKRECDTRGIHLTLLPPIPAGLVEVSDDDDLHQDLRVETPQGWGELSGPETKQCFDPWEKMVITRDGSVYPCDVYGLSSGALGNLTTQSFEEVWRGNPFTNFRRDLLQGYRSGCLNCVRRQTGPHPLLHCAARIHNERCWSSEHQANVSVENIGTFTWTKNTQLHVGTSARRDRTDSTYYHPGWLSANRVSTFLEEQVAPGQIATFRFPIASHRPSVPERFQLVFEHQFWLPNTVFQLPFPKAGWSRASLLISKEADETRAH